MFYEGLWHFFAYDMEFSSCFTILVQSVTLPVIIPVLLLIDLSEVNITKLKKRIVLAGLTAAKKLIALRWQPPHSLTISLTFLDVIYLKLSTARINGASEASINNLCSAADSLKELIR